MGQGGDSAGREQAQESIRRAARAQLGQSETSDRAQTIVAVARRTVDRTLYPGFAAIFDEIDQALKDTPARGYYAGVVDDRVVRATRVLLNTSEEQEKGELLDAISRAFDILTGQEG